MKSDIEIAQEAKLIRIDDLAHSAGLSDDEFEPYGRDKAVNRFLTFTSRKCLWGAMWTPR